MQLKHDKINKMKTEIIDEKKNPLFNRKEIILEIESNAVPSHVEAEKIVSEKFKSSPDALKIKKIAGKFGSRVFKISANVYSSKEEKESIEAKSKKEKEAEKKSAEESKKAEDKR